MYCVRRRLTRSCAGGEGLLDRAAADLRFAPSGHGSHDSRWRQATDLVRPRGERAYRESRRRRSNHSRSGVTRAELRSRCSVASCSASSSQMRISWTGYMQPVDQSCQGRSKSGPPTPVSWLCSRATVMPTLPIQLTGLTTHAAHARPRTRGARQRHARVPQGCRPRRLRGGGFASRACRARSGPCLEVDRNLQLLPDHRGAVLVELAERPDPREPSGGV
jgi:hypothetical protein